MADVISCDTRNNQGQTLIFPDITKKAQPKSIHYGYETIENNYKIVLSLD